MTKVNVTKTINVSAESAWKNLSSFRGIEHFSPIARSVVEGNGVGATRSCFMPDDAEIKEVMSGLDNEAMTLEYKILSGPFPFENYISTVKVMDKGSESCEVSWGSNFDAAEEHEAAMKELLDGFYNAMIDGLETLIQSKS